MRHVLVVGFDGLRPDLVRPELTPHLCRLQTHGVTFARHRTVYPSETRVAFTSLVTGAPVSAHGLIGNRYLDRSLQPPRYVNTADAALLEALDAESSGRLVTTPTLGELLAGAGRSLAVIATNSRGATHLLNHKARELGHVCLSGHFGDVGTPDGLVREVVANLGPVTPEAKPEPSIEAQAYITTAFLDHVWPKAKPGVTILFYGEPDTSSHFNGILSEKTRRAIRACDAQFGRVLNWWEARARDEGVQIIAISDHGHVTQHTRVSVADALLGAGFNPGTAPGSGVDAIVIPGHVGAIYLAEPAQAALVRAARALMDQPWCGSVFTAGRNEVEGSVPGTLASSLVFADHARAPDIQFSFRTDDRTDPYGLLGGSFFDNGRATGTGVHGGLHPKELGALAVAAGTELSGGLVSITPSGICDIAPTIIHLLGVPPPASMTGRVLHEALVGSERMLEVPPEPEVLEAGYGFYAQALRRVRVASTTYVDGGWAGSDAGAAAQRNQAWG